MDDRHRPSIFILEDDDNRIKWFKTNFNFAELTIAKTFKNAIELYIGTYDLLLLDHDLGLRQYVDIKDEETGSNFCSWLNVTHWEDELNVIVHSMNKFGAEHMIDLLGLKPRIGILQWVPFHVLTKYWDNGDFAILGFKSTNLK
jgi:hypothetical protein